MFKRRKPLTILQNLKELFWPTMGWVRAGTYIKHRVIRLSDSNHKIALGLSFGTAISFTPIVGTHFIQAGILSYIFRGNLIASLIGTFAGNPWTFPFMWWAAISFGSYLFGLLGLPAQDTMPEEVTLSIMWEIIKHEPLRIFLPWAAGGYLLGILSMIVTYPFYFNIVKGAKIARDKTRKKARMRKLHKTAKEITGQRA